MESSAPRSPDLTTNPIMDMGQEEEAVMTDQNEDEDEDRDSSDPTFSGEDASHSAEQEVEDDEPNLSLPTHASFVSSSPTSSAEYDGDDIDESFVIRTPIEADKNKGKGRVVEDSEDELDLIASPAKQEGKKRVLGETPDVTSIREKLQGVSLAASARVTRSRLKNIHT